MGTKDVKHFPSDKKDKDVKRLSELSTLILTTPVAIHSVALCMPVCDYCFFRCFQHSIVLHCNDLFRYFSHKHTLSIFGQRLYFVHYIYDILYTQPAA